MAGRPLVHPRRGATLRHINEGHMPDEALIRYVLPIDRIQDGQGGHTDPNPWPVKATVPCRVETGGAMPQERHTAENGMAAPWLTTPRIEAIDTWVLVVPVGTVVPDDARIDVGDRTFEVVSALGPHSYDTCLNIVCKEMT